MKATTMAIASNVVRTCGLIFYVISQAHGSVVETPNLIINSIDVGSVSCNNITCKYLLIVRGGEFLGYQRWRLTSEEGVKGAACEIIYPNYELKELETSQWSTKLEVSVPENVDKIYFCLRQNAKNAPYIGSWIHQGVQHFLEPKKDASSSQKNELSNTTSSSNSASSHDLQASTQMIQNLENSIDNSENQEVNIDKNDLQMSQQEANIDKNEIQEVNKEWGDLTHDTDVNYLPNVPRPTREEKNDIEVLVNHTFVPLNDLIEQIRVDSKKSGDFFGNRYESYIDKDVKQFLNDDNDEIMDLNSVNVIDNDENLNLMVIDEKINIVRENIDKIDDVVSKLLSSKIFKEAKDSNVENPLLIHMPIQEKANTLTNSAYLMPFEEIPEESINLANRQINTKEILKKLDNILAKIQGIKCDGLQPYVPHMQSNIVLPDLHISDANTPDNFSPNTHKPSLKALDLQSHDMRNDLEQPDNPLDISKYIVPNLKTTRIPDVKSFDISPDISQDFTQNLNEITNSGAKISDLLYPNMKTPDLTQDFVPNPRKKRIEDFETSFTPSFDTKLPNKAYNDMHSPDISKDLTQKLRKKRQLQPEVDFTSVRAAVRPIVIEGIRIEDSDKEPKIIDDGVPSVLADSSVTLRVFGEGLTERTAIAFTHYPQPYGQPCKFLLKGEYLVKEGSLQPKTALFQIRVPSPITGSKLYICAKNLQYNKNTNDDEEKYAHQGEESWKMFASHNKLLPLWVSIGLILFCLMFSALFSGLNLGLMSLDRTELKIIGNTGTEQERKHARAIMPVRDHGNYLLCSILLGNVAVNSTFTILLDELTSGLFAVIFSTLAIVLLGEITPQAICSRHGLMVGARTILITKGVMAVTAPLSFPVSKLLDYFLGEEIGNVYNRERLKELVKVTTDVNDLDKDEVNIISGALEMRKKTVKDVMTKLEDVFMLPITSVLDFETMSEIVKSGYSRIPVYEGTRGNILTVLFIKDLAFVDPDDNTPLRTLCQYYQNAAHFVFEDVTLDVMFKQFKDGHKGHMAFVHRINNEGEGDPFYETIGLVTLEDVIEEMIQSEIVDETDVFLDNRSKRRRRPQNKLQDFAAFAERHENQRIHISPQLTLATFQFLNTSVDAFRPDLVSETVLRRLLKQDVIQYIKIKEKSKKDPSTYVFQQGKPVDYFVLILEGRVEVTVGRENLVFEAGPFTYFGVQALTQNVGVAESPTPSAMGSLQNINMDAMLRHTFVPDYSVRAITSVYYLTVKRSLYLAAKRATLMEKGNISKGGQTTQEFDTEVDKLLQSVDEDLSITGEHKTPSRQVSPHPMPVSPAPRAADSRNGHAYAHTTSDEQERLLK